MVAVVLPIVLSVLLVVMIVLIYKGRKTIRLICKRQSKLTPPQDADQLLSKSDSLYLCNKIMLVFFVDNLGMPSGAAYGSTVPIRGTTLTLFARMSTFAGIHSYTVFLLESLNCRIFFTVQSFIHLETGIHEVECTCYLSACIINGYNIVWFAESLLG